MKLILFMCAVLHVHAGKRKLMLNDLFEDYKETVDEIVEENSIPESEELGSFLKQVVLESRTVRRRLNRAIQENETLRKRLSKIEFLIGGEAPADENEIIFDFRNRLDDLESTKIKNQVRFTFLENEYAKQNSQLVASVAKQNDNTENINKLNREMTKLKSETIRYDQLNGESGNLLDDLKFFKKKVKGLEENFRDELKDEILAEVLSQSDDANLEMSIGMRRMSIGTTPTGERAAGNSFEMMNMAKAMWNLPSSCDELADRGLTSNDSGSYLISPGESEPFLVRCDFERGTTTIGISNYRNRYDFQSCNGKNCSAVAIQYDLEMNQIESLKSEMKSCHQNITFNCDEISLSDRVIWTGPPGSATEHRYFNGHGTSNGCACSMGEFNECDGDYMCNCDATSGRDTGAIFNKSDLPITGIYATDVRRGSLSVSVGDFVCYGRPGWSSWSGWSLCDASCDKGVQIRTRICEGDKGKCPGESIQSQPCNEHKCPTWSNWSAWSQECIDRTTKKTKACGEKERFRLCSEGSGCPGEAIEYQQCDCILILGGNGHKLNASLVDVESNSETPLDLGTKVQMPALTAHCIVNYKERIFVIGGWNTRDSVFELRDCGLIPMRFKLPRDYRVHSCAVHDDRIWVCGSRDAPYACDSYDENWEHQQEKNTIHAHSYGSMVSAPDRGLTIIGGVAPMLGRNDKVEFYSNGKWSNGPRLPNILSSHTSHIIDSDIYVFGGLIADSGRLGQVDTVYHLGRSAEKWTSISRLGRPRSHHASVLLPNNQVFVFGDPYVASKAEIWSAQNHTELATVKHSPRAFPAAILLNKSVC